VRSTEEFEAAFSLPVVQQAQAMNINALALGRPIHESIAQLALQYRLAAIATSNYAEKGLLMDYGANVAAIARRAAVFVDRILKSANPADLPVELPTMYDLAVNVRTAHALGLTIPPEVAVQVTQWIELTWPRSVNIRARSTSARRAPLSGE
jgi:putative ABC transport system substrate-binding protein